MHAYSAYLFCHFIYIRVSVRVKRTFVNTRTKATLINAAKLVSESKQRTRFRVFAFLVRPPRPSPLFPQYGVKEKREKRERQAERERERARTFHPLRGNLNRMRRRLPLYERYSLPAIEKVLASGSVHSQFALARANYAKFMRAGDNTAGVVVLA